MSKDDEYSTLVTTELAEESKALTDEETQVFEELKKHIGEVGVKVLTHENQLRFVRGYAFEKKSGGVAKWISVACSEADKTIAWRQKVDADTLLNRPLPRQDIFQSSYVSGIYGTDNKGHPILVERIQDMNIDTLLTFSIDELSLFQAKNMELLQHVKAQISEKLQKLVYKHVYILDLSGLGTNVYKGREQLKAIFHVAQYYYPETLYKMFMIHSPMLFRAVYAMVSPFIHPITKEKIKILGGKSAYLPELAANGIALDQIPTFIGGTYSAGPRKYHSPPPTVSTTSKPSPSTSTSASASASASATVSPGIATVNSSNQAALATAAAEMSATTNQIIAM